MTPRDRLIFALDVGTRDEATGLVDRLVGHVGCFKIGLGLFIAAGSGLVRWVRERAPVFLDLKLHDIPASVGSAAAAAGDLGVDLLTVHVDEDGEALMAAVRAAPNVGILGVTVLTCVAEGDLPPAGFRVGLAELVRLRAVLARNAGCAGVVCSGHEAADLRRLLGPDMGIVVPGVRPAGTAAADQKRIVTPASAMLGGADRIVVGRPIRDAPDPVKAADDLVREIAAAM